MSRFKIHDEESAPEAAQPILKSTLKSGGQLPNFLGVLGGSPVALRGYVRLRAELRRHDLPAGTLERIGLAVARAHNAAPLSHDKHARAAREAGWTDEQLIEALAVLALEAFAAMVDVAGEVPVDGSSETSRRLQAVA